MLDWTTDFIQSIFNAIISFLPSSPFKDLQLPDEVRDILPYINWVIPFGAIVATVYAWLLCIVVYYAYQIIMRWINAVS